VTVALHVGAAALWLPLAAVAFLDLPQWACSPGG